jgi:hypothetical protein
MFDRNGERRSVVISATAPTRAGTNTKMGTATAGSPASTSDDSDDDDDSDD